MTHKERIERTLEGRDIDRPAISAWRHFYHLENSADDLAAAMFDFQKRFDWDFMKINPRASYHIEPWGARFQYSIDPFVKPQVLSLPVRKTSDWTKIKQRDWNSGALGEIIEASRKISELIGDDVYSIQTVFTPLSVAADMVASEEEFVRLLHEGPGELHAALVVITETFVGFVKALLKTGMAGIFLATTEWACRDLLTEEEYLEFGRPYDLKVLDAASGAMFNVIHVCAKNNMLPLFREYPAPVLSWNPFEPGNLSVHQAAQICDKIFMTGMDQKGPLLNGPPEDLGSQIEGCLHDAEPGRLVVGPGCAIDIKTPEEHLKAAKKIVEGFRL